MWGLRLPARPPRLRESSNPKYKDQL
ncbi:BnaA01g29330D [Brassica napus]|uniref:BnaA01g29330D protein n=1 Tax=Brassica napus TaxID=3708 RepID=A0A078HQT0_BRANA|nr:BnaA01g29330D [Brassica napus]